MKVQAGICNPRQPQSTGSTFSDSHQETTSHVRASRIHIDACAPMPSFVACLTAAAAVATSWTATPTLLNSVQSSSTSTDRLGACAPSNTAPRVCRPCVAAQISPAASGMLISPDDCVAPGSSTTIRDRLIVRASTSCISGVSAPNASTGVGRSRGTLRAAPTAHTLVGHRLA